MRAGLSTIQQTLTPEAASVLNHSIAEAGRRNHGQTTPLHVAATLLASPSGFLRQACIKSHPNSSHPLQCRALELCFSVALERLPTAAAQNSSSSSAEPPISNALMAALKRAQAHQRRGCPEQQQQPLLAVKVELEQLIISILDDPSVSRVMREASFSSPAVKATIEQSLTSTASNANLASSCNNPQSSIPFGFRPGPAAAAAVPGRNLYLNPRLQQQQQLHNQHGGGAQPGQMRAEEVIDILMRTRKRNPVLVGDSEPEAVVREILRRIEGKELGELMRNVEVVHLEKEVGSDRTKTVERVKELAGLVEARIGKSGGGGVVLNLGDLKWLVEQPVSLAATPAPQQQVVSEAGRAAVAEVAKLLAMFGDGGGSSGGGRLWLIGTATCETYLRCQVYHPSMENDWDLQAVPITAKAPVLGLFPRLGTNGILSSSVESLSPLKGFPTAKLGPPRRLSENLDPSRRTATCCPQCMQSYEQELSKFVAKESEKSSSNVKLEGARPPLPQWLQNAKARDGDAKTSDQTQAKEQELTLKQKTKEMKKKWSDTCLHLHPSFHHQPNFSSERMVPTPMGLSMVAGLYNPNLLGRQTFQPKLQMSKSLGETLQLNTNPALNQHSERTNSLPGSPVRTDLVLGQTKANGTLQEQSHKDRIKDLISCISSEVPQNKLFEIQKDDKMASKLDADSFKKLSKVLAEKVWWQPEAAVGVAATMTECKLGSGKRRGAGSKGDMWVLFLGPDRVGKKRMASALAQLVSGSSPVTICLSSRRGDGESDLSFRGKTVVDRIAEAVRRNPFAVIVLEDVNEAEMLIRGSIKRAMDGGRLADSHGREVSLGNVVFILTADWLPDNLKNLSNGVSIDEEKVASIAKKPWQLRLLVSGRTAKRRAHWLHDDDQRPTKPRKEMTSALAFDLNEAADTENDKADGSHNSSDLTIDREEYSLNNRPLLAAASPPPPKEILDSVEDTIVFKAVEYLSLRNSITSTIANRFSNIVGVGILLEMDEDAVEKILSGLWIGRTSLEEWTEKVLVPSFDQLKSSLPGLTADESVVVRLESDGELDGEGRKDLLPSSVKVVMADG